MKNKGRWPGTVGGGGGGGGFLLTWEKGNLNDEEHNQQKTHGEKTAVADRGKKRRRKEVGMSHRLILTTKYGQARQGQGALENYRKTSIG